MECGAFRCLGQEAGPQIRFAQMDPTVLSLTGARSFENGGSVMEGEPPSKKQKVGGEEDKDAKDKKRRAYRACLHCRNR